MTDGGWLTSVAQIASFIAGANVLAALGQHFNQLAADAITDCIGAVSIPFVSKPTKVT